MSTDKETHARTRQKLETKYRAKLRADAVKRKLTEEQAIERTVKALESIADSLFLLAHPRLP